MNVNLHIDNHALVEECRKGDKEALNLFYLRFAPRMHCVIRRYITDTKDAEDILHDGFVVALTRLESLRDPERVEYWLATIMRNLSLQFLQNQDVVEILHELPEVEEVPEIENMIDLDTLEVLIRKLPDGYQKVFRLAVLENKSHKEIGRLLGIAPNTSSSQLFHARMMMRRLITEYKVQAGILSVLIVVAVLFLSVRFGNDGKETLVAKGRQEFSATETHIGEGSEESLEEEENREKVKPEYGRPASSGSGKEFLADAGEVAIVENNEIPLDVRERNQDIFVGPPAESVSSSATCDPVAILDEHPIVKGERSSWSLRGGVSVGVKKLFGESDELDMAMNDCWGDSWNKDPDSGEDSSNLLTRAWPDATVDRTMENLMNAYHENDQPLSFSLTVSRSFSNMLSLETGFTYTYLHSTFESMMSTSDCRWHYLGIPLKVNLTAIEGRRWRIYASAGVEFEIPLVAKSVVTTSFNQPDLYSGRFSAYSLWTSSVSCGVSFGLTDKIDMFIAPSLQYRFHHKYKVPNIWTDDRFGFTMPIGFRLNL